VFVVHVGKGEEVLSAIGREAGKRDIQNAAITLIGAVERCTVSVMPKGDPSADILTDHEQPFELAGIGEIVDGKVHVHVSMGGEDGAVVGHLHSAEVDHWFVRAYVTPVAD
jgi:predicted DNA-binding protein with PD1-like motif